MWYSVVALYQSHIETSDEYLPLLDRTIFLINVLEGQQPSQKAETIAKKNEHEYDNENGERVVWRLVSVLEIQDLCEETLYDGIEVYSHLERAIVD